MKEESEKLLDFERQQEARERSAYKLYYESMIYDDRHRRMNFELFAKTSTLRMVWLNVVDMTGYSYHD